MSGFGDSNLYPQLGRGNSQAGFQPPPPPQHVSSPNLQYYSQPPAGGSYGGVPQGASVLDGLGSGLMSQVGGAAFGPMGQQALFTGKQLVNENIGRFMTLEPLKYYFNVNNSYVMNKIRLLLCPFFHKSWKRRIMRVGEVDKYAFPREDINAPDLYIPVMAFVSYILLVGFVLGTSSQFTPEVLGITASKGMATLGLEILILKTVFYLFNCGGVSVLDLIAYCGYKFVGLVASMLIGIVFGGYVYFLAAIYIGLVMGFFMIRTLRLVFVLEASRAAMEAPSNSSAKNYFLLVIAAFQILVVYFLTVVA